MTSFRRSRHWTLPFIILVLLTLSCRALQGAKIQVVLPTEKAAETTAPEATPKAPAEKGNPATTPAAEATPSADIPLDQHFRHLGQIGGNSYALALDGSTAYLGVGPRLLAVDVSSPASPQLIAQSEALAGVVRGIALRPPYAYLAAGRGHLRVLDISDPRDMHEVGSLEDFQWAMAVVLEGDRLYIADNAQGLWIADLKDPAHPELLGSIQLKQPAAALAVSGNWVYVVHMSGGLMVIDASDPTNPTLKTELPLPQMSAGIALSGSAALIAAGIEGLWVVDISDPARPVKTGSVMTTWADGITLDGRLAYLTDSMQGLLIFDVTDPFNPRQVGAVPLVIFSQSVPGQRQLVARDGKVLLANQNQGMLVVDASDPAQPRQVASYDAPLSGSAFDAVADGTQVFVTRDFIGLGGVDVQNPAAPAFLGSESSFVKGAPVRTTWKLAVQGGYAFSADVNLGFRVVELGGMQEVARLDKPRSWSSVALDGSLAFGATVEHDPKDGDPEAKRSLRVVDISEPTSPRPVGVLKMENNAHAVAVRGGIVYYPDYLEIKQDAANTLTFLHLVDVSNPAKPVEILRVETTGGCPHASSIVLKGSYVILGEQQLGLCVIDVSDPKKSTLVTNWRDAPTIYDMALAGDRLFLACYGNVVAVDLRNPLAPVLEDMTLTPGLAYGIDAVGEQIFVSDMDGGLVILGYQ